MKKLILLLAFLVSFLGHSQANFDEGIQLTNITDNTASKVNVQNSAGIVNTISKTSLIEVLEVANAAALPTTGTAGKIYVTIDNQLQYRWTGSIYTPYFSGKEDTTNKKSILTASNAFYPTNSAVINGLNLKADLSGPFFSNNLNISANPINSTTNRLRQTMGTNDDWAIFGDGFTADKGILVFEVGNNGAPFDSGGQKFEFRYLDSGAPANNKIPLIVDYNKSTFNGNVIIDQSDTEDINILKILDFAGPGIRNISVSSLGEIIVNPIQIKSYVAILNQSALVAPSASIISNTLSGTPLWAYISPGQYSLTLTGAFPLDKTYISGIVGDGTAAGDATYKCFRFSNDVILLNTTFNAAYTNGQLNKASFKIDVYN